MFDMCFDYVDRTISHHLQHTSSLALHLPHYGTATHHVMSPVPIICKTQWDTLTVLSIENRQHQINSYRSLCCSFVILHKVQDEYCNQTETPDNERE